MRSFEDVLQEVMAGDMPDEQLAQPYLRLVLAANYRSAERPTTPKVAVDMRMAELRLRSLDPCFSVLGVAPSCSADDVRRAFRKKALLAHPDRPTGSHTAFVELQRAEQRALALVA